MPRLIIHAAYPHRVIHIIHIVIHNARVLGGCYVDNSVTYSQKATVLHKTEHLIIHRILNITAGEYLLYKPGVVYFVYHDSF